MKTGLILMVLSAALYFPGSMPAHAAVYRCESHHKTIYSDHPCGKQATRITVAPAQAVKLAAAVPVSRKTSGSEGAQSRHAMPCRYDRLSSTEMRNLRVSHVIMVCEPADAVRAAWGRPDKIVRQHSHGHVREHWIYRGADRSESRSVRLEDGRVVAFRK